MNIGQTTGGKVSKQMDSCRPGFALCNPNITGLLQGEHSDIFARIRVGAEKSGPRRTKALIYLKRGKIWPLAKVTIEVE